MWRLSGSRKKRRCPYWARYCRGPHARVLLVAIHAPKPGSWSPVQLERRLHDRVPSLDSDEILKPSIVLQQAVLFVEPVERSAYS